MQKKRDSVAKLEPRMPHFLSKYGRDCALACGIVVYAADMLFVLVSKLYDQDFTIYMYILFKIC